MLDLFNPLAPPRGVRSFSVNAENPTGARGAAARTASPLGPGRKGTAFRPLPAGEELVLADLEGPGVVRHLWITVPDRTEAGPFVLRDLVLRMTWDDAEAPAVEVPLGDFFCNGFATRALVTSALVVVAPTGGFNCYVAMPFRSRARITLTSEHGGDVEAVFFQVDGTLGDQLDPEVGYFHAQWRRSNGTTAPGEDHVLLSGATGPGTYLGSYIGLTSLQRYWWGEGEVKFYVDGDGEHPSLCSTGLEDYAGGAWAFQDALRAAPEPEVITFSAPFCGYPFRSVRDETAASPFATAMAPSHGMYRWHLPDPVHFESDLRVELQQIGAWDHGLFERSDDLSTVAYWYQSAPSLDAVERPVLPPAPARWPR